MLQQRVHILFSYLCLVFVKKTFYSAPAAKVSISAIVKFLHAQQIKMSTHAHTHLWTSYHTIHAMWMTSVSCCCLPSLSLPPLLLPPEDSNRLKSTTMCTRWNARHDDGKWGWQLWLDDDDDVATWRDSMRRQLVSQIHTHTHTLVKWLPDKSNWVYQRHPVCVNNLMRLWIMLLERGQGRVTSYSINYLSKLCERTKIYQNISNIYHNIRIYII